MIAYLYLFNKQGGLYMYKFLRIYDVKTKGNEVLAARYEVLSEFEEFNCDELMEQRLINICKSKNMPDINEGCMYSVVKYENNIPVADEAQLFYHTDNNGESFLDIAECDARIITGVALGCDLSISRNSTLNNNVHNDKLNNSYEEYRKLCDEYSQKVKYPEYGEWCKESIFKIIKEHGISDNEEYLITKAFNPNSDLYECLDGNDPEYVLSWINSKPHFKESLYDIILDRFLDAYGEQYETLNKELADREYEEYTGLDILADIINRAEDGNIDLFYKALNEIGVNGFKEYILQLVQK